MNPLEALSGTLVNTLTVVVGSGLGLLLRGRLPARVHAVVLQAVGLVSLFIGISGAFDLGKVGDPPGVLLGLLALAIGGAIGEGLRIDVGLERLGQALQQRFKGQGRFSEGFVMASLVFCVGPMTLVGSLQNGLLGDPSLLLLKATLDGFTSLALAASMGSGVMASALVVLLLQGGLALGAGAVASFLLDPAGDPRVLLLNGVGGLMIMGIGLVLLDIRKVAVANMLPALPLIVLLYELLRRLF